jgi:dihydropteroate synthase
MMLPADGLPRLMGVVNVTPDSFSDGGRWSSAATAIDHALRLVDDGADIVDVGGESTRPGALPVDAVTEAERVLPVIKGIRAVHPTVAISIDTSKATIARAAVEAGATIVNDVTAGTLDDAMISTVANLHVPYIAMHMQGAPRTMQENPTYGDVVMDVHAFLASRVLVARQSGIEDVWIDPGIGFGKTLEHNVQLLKSLTMFHDLGPIVLGISRKRFLGAITGLTEATDRDPATVLAHALLLDRGCAVLRVHNVAMTRQLLMLARAFGVLQDFTSG